MTNGQPRSKYWCFTLNNYTAEEKKSVEDAVSNNEDISYVCFGMEVGANGTQHLQGYMEFKQRIRRGAVKRISGFGRTHLETRQGTQSQAIEYCKKEGDFYEFGTAAVSQKGKRNDLEAVRKLIDSGAPESKIADEYFGSWCRYRKSFKAYKDLKFASGFRDVTVYSLVGEPGVGKTRIVFENEPELWICNDPTLQWFDGYEGEPAVLLDDYRGNGNEAFLLRLLDVYPLKVPVKGGFVNWRPMRIYITSNMWQPYGHIGIQQALARRIKTEVRFGGSLYEGEGFEERMREVKAQLNFE